MAAVPVDDKYGDFPSFFKIVIEPRDDLTKLEIPKKFMTDYGTDLTDVVSFVVPTGETWKVKLHEENDRVWFGVGWSEFTSYYSICHGHFLMFTYASMSHFKVCIFDLTACEIEYPLVPPETMEIHNKVISESMTNTDACAKEERMVALVRQCRRKFETLTRVHITKINSYRFQNPSFTVMMQASYVICKFYLNVPMTFAAEYLKDTQVSFTLQTTIGDKWSVIFQHQLPKFKRFTVGWKEFALDNNLRVGDICVFELVNETKCLFKVDIIRCGAAAGVAAKSNSEPRDLQDDKIEVISIDD